MICCASNLIVKMSWEHICQWLSAKLSYFWYLSNVLENTNQHSKMKVCNCYGLSLIHYDNPGHLIGTVL